MPAAVRPEKISDINPNRIKATKSSIDQGGSLLGEVGGGARYGWPPSPKSAPEAGSLAAAIVATSGAASRESLCASRFTTNSGRVGAVLALSSGFFWKDVSAGQSESCGSASVLGSPRNAGCSSRFSSSLLTWHSPSTLLNQRRRQQRQHDF